MAAEHADRQRNGRPRILQSPFTWFVLLLLGLEWLAAANVPYHTEPTAAEAVRLAREWHGWPEYVTGSRERDGPLVVIISNSQGHGTEFRDVGDTFAGRLRESLAQHDPPISIENWSCSGLRTAELELLSMQAVQRRADLVLYLLSHRNIDLDGEVELNMVSSDISLLAGRWQLWGPMGDSLVGPTVGWEDRLVSAIQFHAQFARARTLVLDWWAQRLDKREERLVLGHVRRLERPAPVDVAAPPRSAEEIRQAWIDRGERDTAFRRIARLKTNQADRRLATLRKLLPPLQRRHDAADVPYLWIWMPTDVEELPPEDLAAAQSFRARGSEIIAANGGRSLEWSEAVPGNQFITLNHFTLEGHASMARLVEEAILDALP